MSYVNLNTDSQKSESIGICLYRSLILTKSCVFDKVVRNVHQRMLYYARRMFLPPCKDRNNDEFYFLKSSYGNSENSKLITICNRRLEEKVLSVLHICQIPTKNFEYFRMKLSKFDYVYNEKMFREKIPKYLIYVNVFWEN